MRSGSPLGVIALVLLFPSPLGEATLTPSEAKTSLSNVLFITLDTTRRDALGCYGGDANTPNIDSLAADGVLFENAYSVAFGTTPSHSSMMTASPAAVHGVYDNDTVLAASHTTLAEVLRDAGFATAAFVSAVPLDRRLGLDQGFEHYDQEYTFDLRSGLGEYSKYERRAARTVDRLLVWIRSRPARPFFAWMHLYDPHQPYWPALRPGNDEPRLITVEGELRERLVADPVLLRQTIASARAEYLEEIEHMDREIGRTIAYLKDQGIYDSTLIVVVADHGENFGGHGIDLLFNHAALFGAVSGVPLIVKLPGAERGGSRSRALVGTLDLAPTVLALAGHPSPPSWSGISFRRILEGSATTFRPHLVLEGAEREEIAIRTPTWFYRELTEELRDDPEVYRYLGYAPGAPVELYSLPSDPRELHNRFPSAEADPLRAIASRFKQRRGAYMGARSESDEHRRQLEALGYLK